MTPIIIVGAIYAASMLALALAWRASLEAATAELAEARKAATSWGRRAGELERDLNRVARHLGQAEAANALLTAENHRLRVGDLWTKPDPDAYQLTKIIGGRVVLEEEVGYDGVRGMIQLTANLEVAEADLAAMRDAPVGWRGQAWKVVNLSIVREYDRFGGDYSPRAPQRYELDLAAFVGR